MHTTDSNITCIDYAREQRLLVFGEDGGKMFVARALRNALEVGDHTEIGRVPPSFQEPSPKPRDLSRKCLLPVPKFLGTSLAVMKFGGAPRIHEYCASRHKELGPVYKEKSGAVRFIHGNLLRVCDDHRKLCST